MDLADLSNHHLRVLRTLSFAMRPIPQHQIAQRSGLAIQSTVNALRDLRQSGLIKRRRAGKFLLHELNANHTRANFFINLFKQEASLQIALRAQQAQKRDGQALRLMADLSDFWSAARNGRGGHKHQTGSPS